MGKRGGASTGVADLGSHAAAGPPANGAGRAIERRRALPSGRALVGGFLVATSAVGIYAAWAAAAAGPTTAYVVAARSVSLGERIEAGDLALRRIDLPAEIPAVRRPADLVGKVARTEIRTGELLQPSMVGAEPLPEAEGPRLSFAVERAQALDGALRQGDRVDVLATYGGDPGWTEAVAADLLVVEVSPGSRLGQRGEVVLTVAVRHRTTLLALAHATRAAQITVVRSGRAAPGPDTYTPDRSARAPAGGPSPNREAP